MAADTVTDTMAVMGLTNETAVAWRAGRRRMMIDTTAALGDGLLIGKCTRTRTSWGTTSTP